MLWICVVCSESSTFSWPCPSWVKKDERDNKDDGFLWWKPPDIKYQKRQPTSGRDSHGNCRWNNILHMQACDFLFPGSRFLCALERFWNVLLKGVIFFGLSFFFVSLFMFMFYVSNLEELDRQDYYRKMRITAGKWLRISSLNSRATNLWLTRSFMVPDCSWIGGNSGRA